MIVMKLETARINYCDIVAAIGVVVGTRVGGLNSLAEFLYLKTGFMVRAPSSQLEKRGA